MLELMQFKIEFFKLAGLYQGESRRKVDISRHMVENPVVLV
jgi:hypothetical protein